MDLQEIKEKLNDAIAEALGSAYDCTRVWSAWGCGTMGPDDFDLVAEDDERMSEIIEAVVCVVSPELARLTQLCEEQGAEIEHLKEQAGDLESQNETLQIEHDVMYARIRDANGQYSPEEVSNLIDAEIAISRAREEAERQREAALEWVAIADAEKKRINALESEADRLHTRAEAAEKGLLTSKAMDEFRRKCTLVQVFGEMRARAEAAEQRVKTLEADLLADDKGQENLTRVLQEAEQCEKGLQAKKATIEITLAQAKELVLFFGGDKESSMTIIQAGPEAHSGEGLYVYCTDYPKEGSVLLGTPAALAAASEVGE